jgi:hypothetical protein
MTCDEKYANSAHLSIFRVPKVVYGETVNRNISEVKVAGHRIMMDLQSTFRKRQATLGGTIILVWPWQKPLHHTKTPAADPRGPEI